MQEKFLTLQQVTAMGTGRVAQGMITVGRSHHLSFVSEWPTAQNFDDAAHLENPLSSVAFGPEGSVDAMSSFGYQYNEVVGPLSIAPAGGVTRGAKSMNPEASKVKQTMVIGSHYIAVYVVKSKKDEAVIETIKSSAKVIRLSLSMIQSSNAGMCHFIHLCRTREKQQHIGHQKGRRSIHRGSSHE